MALTDLKQPKPSGALGALWEERTHDSNVLVPGRGFLL